jgi:hypothetical protein
MREYPDSFFTPKLCIEKRFNKLHIEFLFKKSKKVCHLGSYLLTDKKQNSLVLTKYQNVGFNFWLFLLLDMQIKNNQLKHGLVDSPIINSPEIYLIDFQYKLPYTQNKVSRILPLSALIDLIRLTINEEYPEAIINNFKSKFFVSGNINKHTQVKISAVLQHVCDFYQIATKCNRTTRYYELKTKILKKIKARVELCEKDINNPGKLSAFIPTKPYLKDITVQRITKTKIVKDRIRNPELDEVRTVISCGDMRKCGMRGQRPTVEWLKDQIDFQAKCVKPDSIVKKSLCWPLYRLLVF